MPTLADIIIDPEFRDLLPEVEDASRLRGKIELEGWSDEPITVWQGHNILLDGHRRLGIWRDRGDEGPQVRELSFASRDAAYHWVVNHQCARRNLTPEQQRYLLGRRYTAEKKCKGAPEGNKNAEKKQCPENLDIVSARTDGFVRTAERIAIDAGVSDHTVLQAEKYADAVDSLDRRGVFAKGEILSGTVKAPASKIIEAAKAPTEEEAKAIIASNKKPANFDDSREPYKPDNERKLAVANKNYKRLGILFGQVFAIADGVEAIKLDAALSVLKRHDADEWIEAAKRATVALTSLSKRLKKEVERAGLSATSEEAED